MLKTEIEYKKGILFVRLQGELNSKTIEKLSTVENIIKKAGIKYLLINLEQATVLSHEELHIIIDKYKKLIGNDGRLLICGYYNYSKIRVSVEDIDKIYLSGNEINAFNIINI